MNISVHKVEFQIGCPNRAKWPLFRIPLFLRGPVSNFYTSVIETDPRFHSTSPINDLSLLEPTMRAAVLAILAESNAAGMPLLAFETYRSQERQAMLFAQGATKLKTVGVHHYGLACDLVKDIGGHPSWKGDFTFLRALAKKHGLIWGGDWGTPNQKHSFIDSDHVQRCTVADQTRLFAGTWYPDTSYNPNP